MSYTTALYFRLSVDDDNHDESNSVKNQRDLLRLYAAGDPVISSGEILEFADDGWSGTTFERPRVKELLALARRGGIQCIAVKDLSRWGRNYVEVGEYIEHILPFLGIRFISVNDRYDSADYKGSTAPTDLAFSSIMHDIYCKELSFKVRQSYIAKAHKGEFLCGEAPFGFVKSKTEKNKLVIDGEAAAVVRRVFAMADGGMGSMEIAAALNGEGVDTPLMYRRRTGRTLRGNLSAVCGDGMWTDKNVRKILTDERYTGVQVSGKTRKPKPGSRTVVSLPESEWIRVPGAHEAIIQPELFERVKAGLRRYTITAAPKRHILFAGKLRCGHCGHALRYQGSAKAFHYCEGPKFNAGAGCFDGRVYLDDLKAVVLAAVKGEVRKVFDERERRKLSASGSSVRAEMEAEAQRAASRIGFLERRGVTLYEDYAEGRLDRDAYIAAKADCAAKLAELESRAAELAARINTATDTPVAPDDTPLLRRVLDAKDVTGEVLSLVDCVTVYDPERIEIRFAFGDTNTVEGFGYGT